MLNWILPQQNAGGHCWLHSLFFGKDPLLLCRDRTRLETHQQLQAWKCIRKKVKISLFRPIGWLVHLSSLHCNLLEGDYKKVASTIIRNLKTSENFSTIRNLKASENWGAPQWPLRHHPPREGDVLKVCLNPSSHSLWLLFPEVCLQCGMTLKST